MTGSPIIQRIVTYHSSHCHQLSQGWSPTTPRTVTHHPKYGHPPSQSSESHNVPKILKTHFFSPNILDLTFFWTHIFFLSLNFSDPKLFSYLKLFKTKIFFGSKLLFLDQKFIFDPNHLDLKFLFLAQQCLTLKF